MKHPLVRLAVIGIGMFSLLLAAAAGALLAPASAQAPLAPSALLGTAITYQGQLKRTGSAVTDTCSMRFRLYDQAGGGTQKGSTLTQSVSVVAGLFAATLDFGNAVFNGEARWLNIQVQCSGDASYVDLGLQALTAAPHALALPGMHTQPNSTSPNVIGGGLLNSVRSGVYGATIAGGGDSINGGNTVDDNWGTVGGGNYNLAGNGDGLAIFATVGGGSQNLASASGATIGGGHYNSARYEYATVAGGQGNDGFAKYTSIGGGEDNDAGADYSTIPGGRWARTRHYGEMAYASGVFGVWPGDAQTSLYVLRNSTSTAASTELFLDGSSQRITLSSGRALVFEIQVVALSDTGGTGAGFRIWGTLRNNGGDTTILGAWGEVIGASPAAGSWSAVASADNTNDALVVHVTGSNGVNVRWVATVRTTEVTW